MLLNTIKKVLSGAITPYTGLMTLYYELPKILGKAFPVGLLLGSLFTFDKLSKDFELTVMRGVGLSFWRILTPVIVLSIFFTGLCFVNLVDFDALWGHRRDPQGYAEEIEKFDVNLGKLLEVLTEEDLLILTADHGNDPTAPGSDHTREYVPLLVYRKNGTNINLGTRTSFADIGASIAENFGLEMPKIGKSFLNEI